MSTARSGPVHAAGQRLLDSFERPVLFAYSFTPEDQPRLLAAAIAKFCTEAAVMEPRG